MQITPRYDGPAVLDLDAVLTDPAAGVVRQRERLADAVRDLSIDEWHAPSRCEGWSIQDVIAHLSGVNRFWTFSIDAGRRGEPTRVLATFDPVTVPEAMVAAVRSNSAAETYDEFVATNAELAAVLASLSDDDWSNRAEAPPGHLAIRAVGAHALWDSWVHERDVLLPLGREQTVEPDELLACLAYAAAIGPAFRAGAGETRAGVLGIAARTPGIDLTLHIGSEIVVTPGTDATAPTITGSAVELVEGLSFRGMGPAIADEHRWMLAGLDTAFDLV